MSRYRVSMDIGGTFTDVVAYDEDRGTYAAGKASTTPHDLTEGVFAGLGQIVDSPASIAFTVHGTTVGLNAFLQRQGREGAAARDRGRRRRLPHRPRQPRAALRPPLPQAEAARAARRHRRAARTARLARRGARAARRGRRPRRRPPRPRRGLRCGRRGAPLQLPEPRPRAAGRGDPARGARTA